MTQLAYLPGRAVLRVTGADRVIFLNGLVSNDIALVAPGRAVWAALLSPQGKWLADFFVMADGESLLLECDATQAAMVAQRLSRFRLRAAVAISPADLRVYAAWNGDPLAGDIGAPDSRLPDAGHRILTPQTLPVTGSAEDWDAHRLRLGLPDGPRDLEADKTVLLEAGFDELHGISWTKGCYMGQELTARTRYRGLIKRRLLPVTSPHDLPPHGTPINQGERDIGTMRSSNGAHGLAVLRLDALVGPLTANGIRIDVVIPTWVRLPGHEDEAASVAAPAPIDC